jgi:hypothetical protein
MATNNAAIELRGEGLHDVVTIQEQDERTLEQRPPRELAGLENELVRVEKKLAENRAFYQAVGRDIAWLERSIAGKRRLQVQAPSVRLSDRLDKVIPGEVLREIV